jgi:hypothetical protein
MAPPDMTQPLFLRIANHPHTKGRLRHHGTILLLRDEIQNALNAGWSRRAIWNTLFAERRVTVKYHAFLRYLRRAGITGPQSPESTASVRPAERSPSTGFNFNRRPSEKDLA